MTLIMTPWLMQQAFVGIAAGSLGIGVPPERGWSEPDASDPVATWVQIRDHNMTTGVFTHGLYSGTLPPADQEKLDEVRALFASLQEQPPPGRQHTGPIETVIEVKDPKNVVGTIVDQSEPTAPPAEIRTADDLLAALQFADQGLQTLRADVVFDKLNDALGDRQIRTGKLWFQTDAAADASKPPRRRFAVHFTSLQLDDKLTSQDQHLVFDGEWFIEKNASQKQFKKRQIVPAGQTIDPLKIGEGPFPIPIGQKRSEILRRYSAELLPATADITPQASDDAKKREKELAAMIQFVTRVRTNVKDPKTGVVTPLDTPATFYQLKLTLRPEYRDEESLREVRLWYRELSSTEGGAAEGAKPVRTLLPRMARTVNRAGDVSIVQLTNVKVNQPVEPGVMDAAPPTDPDWEVTVTPLEGEPAPQ